jgi:hypothetical protein
LNPIQPTVRNAARLTYKALHATLSPVNDPEYRELLALYRADTAFQTQVQDVATGLELMVLEASDRGLIVVPSSRDSKFAVRMQDIRLQMTVEQRAGLVLAHVAVAAVFFPTTAGLEDDNYTPPPASVAQCRDALHALARRMKDADTDTTDMLRPELTPGWEMVGSMPVVLPGAQRASPNSVVGLVKMALSNMQQSGLVRVDQDSEEDASQTYTPTYRLRVQLRELAMRRLFDLAQSIVRAETEH